MADNPDGPGAAHKTLLERFWLPIIVALIGLASATLPILLKGSGAEARPSEPRREAEKPVEEKPRPSERVQPKESLLPASAESATSLGTAQFPRLSQLASRQERIELESCNALMAELGLSVPGLDSIPFASYPESDEWAHECNLEESSFKDAAGLAAVINETLSVGIGARHEDDGLVWEWTLATLHRGAHLDLIAKNGVPSALVVISPYGAGNYCLGDERKKACGSWGDGRPLQIFSRGGVASFTFLSDGDSLHGSWEVQGNQLVLYVEPGQHICGELEGGEKLHLQPRPSTVVANGCFTKRKCVDCSRLIRRD